MKCVDDFRFRLGQHELVPIMIGGMGVDISTVELALEAARLGGVGHISDAMVPTVIDRHFKTRFVKDKLKLYKANVTNLADKSWSSSILGELEEATRMHVRRAMDAKHGPGMVFINCMEKLTMNAPKETLKVRLNAALDAGIDGITLAAGLHLGSFGLMEEHPASAMPRSASSFPACAPCSCSSARMRAPTGCPITSWSKARWPAATWASAWTGRITIWPASSAKSRPG
jgi:nitronate monooxygenase